MRRREEKSYTWQALFPLITHHDLTKTCLVGV